MQRKPCYTNFKSLTRPEHQKRASVTDIAGNDLNATGALGPPCSVSVLLKTLPVSTSTLTGAHGRRPDPDESGYVDVDTVLRWNS